MIFFGQNKRGEFKNYTLFLKTKPTQKNKFLGGKKNCYEKEKLSLVLKSDISNICKKIYLTFV